MSRTHDTISGRRAQWSEQVKIILEGRREKKQAGPPTPRGIRALRITICGFRKAMTCNRKGKSYIYYIEFHWRAS
jgi:hypothetical protein